LQHVTGMVRTQMFIQQRPARTELLPQATTAGLNISASFVARLQVSVML